MLTIRSLLHEIPTHLFTQGSKPFQFLGGMVKLLFRACKAITATILKLIQTILRFIYLKNSDHHLTILTVEIICERRYRTNLEEKQD